MSLCEETWPAAGAAVGLTCNQFQWQLRRAADVVSEQEVVCQSISLHDRRPSANAAKPRCFTALLRPLKHKVDRSAPTLSYLSRNFQKDPAIGITYDLHISEACIYQAANFAGDTDYRHARSDRPVIPDIDDDPATRILTAELQPGDMLAWDSYTFHSAPGNTLNQRRAAFSINWASDAIRFHDIPCLASYRAPELTEGSSITCDKFPLVRGK